MGREAIRKGREEPPYAYVIPPARQQHDPHAARQLVEILRENGLEARRATTELKAADGQRWESGSTVFLAAQPYRSFLVEMMERQRYPEIRQGTDTREIVRPYDVTAWTLPLLMGVSWARVDEPFEGELEVSDTYDVGGGMSLGSPRGGDLVLGAHSNAAYRLVNLLLARGVRVSRALEAVENAPAPVKVGDFLVDRGGLPAVQELIRETGLRVDQLPEGVAVRSAALRAPRVGLYKPWAASMDEGWTRFVLDRHGFKYASLDNAAMRQKSLGTRFDVIVLPDIDKNVIVEGRPRSEDGGYFEALPPAYAGGIGKDGVAALKAFVEAGGTLVCLSSSGDLATEDLGLPVRNVVAKAKSSEFSVPGTLVNLEVDPSHPLAWGMPAKCTAYSTGGPVFATSIPGAGVDRSVVARYPPHADQVVASGWAKGTEQMAGRPAIVESRLQKGRVVLLGPRVQNRAWSVGTFKFLFNAILRAGLED